MNKKNEPKYSLEVYEDHAIITGWLSTAMLSILINLCECEGFDIITHNDDREGFKLVRKALVKYEHD